MVDLLNHTQKLDKKTYKAIEAKLRNDLLDAQKELRERKTHAIMILVNGMDGAGKGEVLNRLYEWLDPRFLETNAVDIRENINAEWPAIWHYWRKMPARGKICVVLGSWYHVMLRERALGNIPQETFSKMLSASQDFESMLALEGVKVLKLWLHIPPEEAQRRYEKAKTEGCFLKPLVQEWDDIPQIQNRQALHKTAKELAQTTSSHTIPWSIIPAQDRRYRDITVGQELLKLMRHTFAEKPALFSNSPAFMAAPGPSIIHSLDLNKTISREKYKDALEQQQQRIFTLTSSQAFRQSGLVLAFEGNDAAGKGSVIRRIRQALDPREFTVHAVSAPNEEERAHPYLWRFWQNIPKRGNTAIFDRSWYGRVLVERVEGYCAPADWQRAYREINAFEQQLTDNNYIVLKFWMAIGQDEQLRRFEARANTPYKQFKITQEDWRNRNKWALYEDALNDMVFNTSTQRAPWTLVAANDKRYAHIKVLKTVANHLEESLKVPKTAK